MKCFAKGSNFENHQIKVDEESSFGDFLRDVNTKPVLDNDLCLIF